MKPETPTQTRPLFTPFFGGVFCQWYYSPMIIYGVEYGCAEQYMMARKAELFQDKRAFAAIMHSDDPGEQKRQGRLVKGFKPEVWNAVARDVVLQANLVKFTSDRKLLAHLMATAGTTLVEASPTDIVWGVGLFETDPRVQDPREWRGTNWLGQVLTDLREQLLHPMWSADWVTDWGTAR